MISIEFSQGTLLAMGEAGENGFLQNIPHCRWDARIHSFRLPGYQYFNLISCLCSNKIDYKDQARAYSNLELPKITQQPFPFQSEAIESWANHHCRGVIILPTGTGKSFVAIMAIATTKRNTIVVVPTLDLMNQWYDLLKFYFPGCPIGLIGGGHYDPQALTVITYDSSYRHLENIGNRFGLIIFDECHHLPSSSYKLAAQFCIAPYRLGLSATPERADNAHEFLYDLVGPFVYQKNISEMSGDYLADYNIVEMKASLSAEERKEYKYFRQVYLDFIRAQSIRIGKNSWHRFIIAASQSLEGRKALLAYFRQREISQAAPAKLRILERLLDKHPNERILIFTHDNATAYTISQRFLVPVITHQTKAKERSEYIAGFNQGKYCILATSRVLNEGVNIPAATIGIILSGSASVREHVQRLGRILRKYGEKKATLYEIITEDTAEEYVSQRRREHEAYQRGNQKKEEKK